MKSLIEKKLGEDGLEKARVDLVNGLNKNIKARPATCQHLTFNYHWIEQYALRIPHNQDMTPESSLLLVKSDNPQASMQGWNDLRHKYFMAGILFAKEHPLALELMSSYDYSDDDYQKWIKDAMKTKKENQSYMN
jgi:hypothetical protein